MKHFSHIKALKIHEILFYCFLFILPIQTRILYKPDQAYISWYFNYHLAFFVYLSDIILVSCFITWLLFDRPKIALTRLFKLILAFFGIILLSLFHVKQANLGLYQTLKWAELLFLFSYIYLTFKKMHQFDISAGVIFVAGIIQSLIALVQFHVQHMIGWGLLGEYIAPLGTPGLATIDTSTGKIIRAYGTMPHPNILGAFLVLSLIMGFFLVSRATGSSISNEMKDPSTRRLLTNCSRWLVFLGLILILLGIFVTFSRLAWIGAVLGVLSYTLYYYRTKEWRNMAVIMFIGVVSCATIFGFYHNDLKARVTNSDSVSLSDRGFFNSLGLKLITRQPWLGIGVGNYVVALEKNYRLQPWQYQPAHNIFIFLAAEIGIIGAILFAFILFEIFSLAWRNLHESLGFAILTVGLIFLILSQFDHYFLTIQQGRLMLFTVLGLIAALPNLYVQKSD